MADVKCLSAGAVTPKAPRLDIRRWLTWEACFYGCQSCFPILFSSKYDFNTWAFSRPGPRIERVIWYHSSKFYFPRPFRFALSEIFESTPLLPRTIEHGSYIVLSELGESEIVDIFQQLREVSFVMKSEERIAFLILRNDTADVLNVKKIILGQECSQVTFLPERQVEI